MKIPTQLRHRLGGLTGPNQISSMRVTSIFALIPFPLQTNVLYAIIFFLTHGYNHSQIFVPVLFISPQFLRSKITINRTPMALWGRGYFYFIWLRYESSFVWLSYESASPYMYCSCFCVPSRLPFFIFIRRDFTAAIQILPQSMLFWKQWAAIFNHICAPIFNPH